MSDSLIPVVLTIGVAVATAGSILGLSALFGRPKRSLVDRSPYECGMTPYQSVQKHRFSVKFYLVAMLFILFDIEAAFLYPWAVTFRDFAAFKWFVLAEMAVFIAILVAGYLYVWWRGALNWE
jgi:NADH-quinone oxidoreductase subunit A